MMIYVTSAIITATVLIAAVATEYLWKKVIYDGSVRRNHDNAG